MLWFSQFWTGNQHRKSTVLQSDNSIASNLHFVTVIKKFPCMMVGCHMLQVEKWVTHLEALSLSQSIPTPLPKCNSRPVLSVEMLFFEWDVERRFPDLLFKNLHELFLRVAKSAQISWPLSNTGSYFPWSFNQTGNSSLLPFLCYTVAQLHAVKHRGLLSSVSLSDPCIHTVCKKLWDPSGRENDSTMPIKAGMRPAIF